MKNLKWYLSCLLVTLLTYFACNKNNPIVSYGPRVHVEFAGFVLDENGQPVSNALVQTEGVSGVTDYLGVFHLKSANVSEKNAILRVRNVGYYDFSRAYFVQDGSVQTVTIHLIRKNKDYQINADNGGHVDLEGTMSLDFPAGALVTESGTTFHGTAHVFARPLNADDPDLAYKMPGDLRGINASGSEGILNTFGMMAVEIEDASGNTLQVAPGKSVNIHMKIPATKASAAPETIALWYYDQEDAHWKEEGSAQKVSGEYVGEVKHFSFWNCDISWDLVYLQGKVYWGDTDHPVTGASVSLTLTSSGLESSACTNNNGWYGGGVPRGEGMQLEVKIPGLCGSQQLFTQQIGPFNDDAVLPDIIIPTGGTVGFTGRLIDCNSQPLGNGFAILSISSWSFLVIPNSTGVFNFSLPDCVSGQTATLTGYDPSTLATSNDISLTIQGVSNLSDIPVCTALDSYIQFTLDGQSHVKVDPLVFFSFFGVQIESQPTDSSSTSPSIHFGFPAGTQPGNYQLSSLYSNYDIFYNPYSTNPPLSTDVTQYGHDIGEYIIGSFAGNFVDSNGTTHTIDCNYRVKIE